MSNDSLLEAGRLLETVYRQKFFANRVVVTQEFVRTIQDAITSEPRKLRLFYLWGVYTKKRLNRYDDRALNFLKQFAPYLSAHFECDAEFTLVVADAHAALNRVELDAIQDYVGEISEKAKGYGWEIQSLKRIWDGYGITLGEIGEIANQLLNEEVVHYLMDYANRYYLGSDKMMGARRYFAARILEKTILKEMFGGFVHVTASDPHFLCLQPEMPYFHIWTLHRGRSQKPWFINNGGETCAG